MEQTIVEHNSTPWNRQQCAGPLYRHPAVLSQNMNSPTIPFEGSVSEVQRQTRGFSSSFTSCLGWWMEAIMKWIIAVKRIYYTLCDKTSIIHPASICHTKTWTNLCSSEQTLPFVGNSSPEIISYLLKFLFYHKRNILPFCFTTNFDVLHTHICPQQTSHPSHTHTHTHTTHTHLQTHTLQTDTLTTHTLITHPYRQQHLTHTNYCPPHLRKNRNLQMYYIQHQYIIDPLFLIIKYV